MSLFLHLEPYGADDAETAPKSETENKHENHRIKFKNKMKNKQQQNNKIITSTKQRNHGADTLWLLKIKIYYYTVLLFFFYFGTFDQLFPFL